MNGFYSYNEVVPSYCFRNDRKGEEIDAIDTAWLTKVVYFIIYVYNTAVR